MGLTTLDMGAPDHARALDQHQAYCEALKRSGLDLTHLKKDEQHPDSTFVEDTVVLTEHCVVLTHPGAFSRRGEVASIKDALAKFYSVFYSIQAPGTLDGGDVCAAGNHLFIGISKRTNEAGAMQLTEYLIPFGYTSSFVDIRRVEGLLHLKSGLAYLGDNRLVAIEPLAGWNQFRGYDLIRVNQEERYAANCVGLNRSVLIPAGYPVLESSLRDLSYETIPLEMSEFQKMDGGLSCLSLRF